LRGSRLRDVRLAHIIARPVVESKIDTGGTLAWGNADVEKGIAMVAAESAHAQMERLRGLPMDPEGMSVTHDPSLTASRRAGGNRHDENAGDHDDQEQSRTDE
jgi:hypothetical protein